MAERSPPDGPSSWTARVLAALALAATTVVLVYVISSSLSGSDGDDERPERQQATTGCEPEDAQAVEDGFYVLEAGEGLADVEAQTCIPVEQLVELNPNLDTQQLPIGGCVDLVVDGCKALADG